VDQSVCIAEELTVTTNSREKVE